MKTITIQIKKATLLFLLISGLNILNAQTTPEEIMSEFFTQYEKSPEKGLNVIMKDQEKFDIDKQSTELIKIQFLNNMDKSGIYAGHEKIMEKSVGNSLKIKSYLMKYEKIPVRLTIIFYKHKDEWLIRDFTFDTALMEDLKKSSKFCLPN